MGAKLDDAALDAVFREGRSYNGYLDQPVSEDDLHAIWDLMKWGPTSMNQQPARIVWCTSQEAKERLAVCAMGTNPDKIRTAPVTAILAMDSEFHEHLPELFPHNAGARGIFADNVPMREASAFRNSTLQGAYLIIAARMLGFDTGPMSGFDPAKVDAAFFADQPRVKTNFLCTLGYGDPASVYGRSPRPGFERFNRIA